MRGNEAGEEGASSTDACMRETNIRSITHPWQNSKNDQNARGEQPDPAKSDAGDGKDAGVLRNHRPKIGTEVEKGPGAGLGGRQPEVKL